MPDYTIPSVPISGAAAADSYDLPQYQGDLFDLMPNNTPFLSMAGGLTGGMSIASREFVWQVEDGEASVGGSTILENAVPTGDLIPRQQVTNVVEIHQEAVEFGYTAQAVVEQLATDSADIEGTNPVRSPMQHQIDKKIGKVARDVEKSFLSGSLVNPANNVTARQTQGILGAITTHVLDYTAGTYTSLRTAIDDLLISMYNPTNEAEVAPAANEEGMFVIFCNAARKVQLSNDYTSSGLLAPRDRSIGGVAVDTLITDFGTLHMVLDRYMPVGTLLLADMSVVAPCFLPIPGKGSFFVEPLAKTGATDKAQLYGEIGLRYGPESFHGKITLIT